MSKVLIADDDVNVREIIRIYFEEQNIELIEAPNGKAAVSLVDSESPDLLILDIMMPELDGYDVCREVRKHSNVPIIMLTAKTEEFDRILGLELGADDYVTKPFSPRELVARIKAIFRRMDSVAESSKNSRDTKAFTYEFGELKIDINRREVLVRGEVINFRPREFDLLVHMAKSPGSVYTREQLLEQVWGYDYIGDIRTVDVHVKKIREKLKRNFIQTVWGIGYKFEVET
ncbi:response regulator transcription factor [Desertibacillus haloalkaliphilus]|uniref:response regulator transcription factor n=1 Tax=Desertibacillus haloalkaliphilus TaxID=1328930 RepID=UPI001C26F899|nr:response regulator transcription factor [Desertibacillus haloalkaliphilus]MBU8905236.1 response regulator transcription factor [Desertibacillus haloalkaliphilus]